jgi:hypothetical protein
VNKYASFHVAIALFCATLCASCGSSQTPAQAGGHSGSARSETADMLCFTSPDSRKIVLSGVFPVRTYPPERMFEEPWAKDFRRYLGQSGNEGGINVICNQVSSADAQKSKADELRKQGHEVVETQWSYAGG